MDGNIINKHLETQCLRDTWCQREVGRCRLAIARILHQQDTAFSPNNFPRSETTIKEQALKEGERLKKRKVH